LRIHPISVEYPDEGKVAVAGTDNCRIEEIKPGSWYYGFDDQQQWFKKDFNEPVLLVEELNRNVRITITNYEGTTKAKILYGTKVLWTGVGGKEKVHVGASSIVVSTPKEVKQGMPWWKFITYGIVGTVGFYTLSKYFVYKAK